MRKLIIITLMFFMLAFSAQAIVYDVFYCNGSTNYGAPQGVGGGSLDSSSGACNYELQTTQEYHLNVSDPGTGIIYYDIVNYNNSQTSTAGSPFGDNIWWSIRNATYDGFAAPAPYYGLTGFSRQATEVTYQVAGYAYGTTNNIPFQHTAYVQYNVSIRIDYGTGQSGVLINGVQNGANFSLSSGGIGEMLTIGTDYEGAPAGHVGWTSVCVRDEASNFSCPEGVTPPTPPPPSNGTYEIFWCNASTNWGNYPGSTATGTLTVANDICSYEEVDGGSASKVYVNVTQTIPTTGYVFWDIVNWNTTQLVFTNYFSARNIYATDTVISTNQLGGVTREEIFQNLSYGGYYTPLVDIGYGPLTNYAQYNISVLFNYYNNEYSIYVNNVSYGTPRPFLANGQILALDLILASYGTANGNFDYWCLRNDSVGFGCTGTETPLPIPPAGVYERLYCDTRTNWGEQGGPSYDVDVNNGVCTYKASSSGSGTWMWANFSNQIPSTGVVYVDVINWNSSNSPPRYAFIGVKQVNITAGTTLNGIAGYHSDSSATGNLMISEYAGYYPGTDTGYDLAQYTQYNITLRIDYDNTHWGVYVDGVQYGPNVTLVNNASMKSFYALFEGYNAGTSSFEGVCIRNSSVDFGCVAAAPTPPTPAENVTFGTPTNNASNVTRRLDNFTAAVNVSSGSTLSHWLYQTNATSGNYENSSITALSGTSASLTADILNNLTVGNTVGVRFWANDTNNTEAWSNYTTFIVANSLPIVTGTYIDNPTPYSNDTITCYNGSVIDNDGDLGPQSYTQTLADSLYCTGTISNCANANDANFGTFATKSLDSDVVWEYIYANFSTGYNLTNFNVTWKAGFYGFQAYFHYVELYAKNTGGSWVYIDGWDSSMTNPLTLNTDISSSYWLDDGLVEIRWQFSQDGTGDGGGAYFYDMEAEYTGIPPGWSYNWTNNGVDIATTATINLQTYSVVPDDNLICYNTFTDNQGGQGFDTATATVQNFVPIIGQPTLSNYSPNILDTVTCYNGSYTDPDPATPTWTYNWSINGVDVTDPTDQTIYIQAGNDSDADSKNMNKTSQSFSLNRSLTITSVGFSLISAPTGITVHLKDNLTGPDLAIGYVTNPVSNGYGVLDNNVTFETPYTISADTTYYILFNTDSTGFMQITDPGYYPDGQLFNDLAPTTTDAWLEIYGVVQTINLSEQSVSPEDNLTCTVRAFDGTNYSNYATSNIATLINPPPIISDNLSSYISASVGSAFGVYIETNYWNESSTCRTIFNSTGVTCTEESMPDSYLSSSNVTSTCTASAGIDSDYLAYSNCTNAYHDLNTTPQTIHVDTTPPVLTITYPSEANTTIAFYNDTFTFNATCTDTSLQSLVVTCTNESGGTVYSYSNSGLIPPTFNFTESTNNFTNSQNYSCTYTCDDYTDTSSTVRQTTHYEIGYVTTDLGTVLDNKTNSSFNVSFDFDFGAQTGTCTVYDNESTIPCTTAIGYAPQVVTCTPPFDTEGIFTFTGVCNNTESPFIGATSASVTAWIDNSPPNPIINAPANDSIYYNTSLVLFNITFQDANLFAYNITCYNDLAGTQEYSVQATDLNVSQYNFTDTHQFGVIGDKRCEILSTDDHTAKDWDTKTKIDKDKGEIEFGEDNKKIKFVWDSKNTIKLEDVKVEKKKDRVSPVLTLERDMNDKPATKEYLDVYWTIEYTGETWSREDQSNIPGHVVIQPEGSGIGDAYWYDALDEYQDTTTDMVIDDKKREIKYHKQISSDEFYVGNGNVLKTKSLGGINLDNVTVNISIINSQIISFAAYNEYNKSDIPVFNVTVNNGTVTTYTTTNGSIVIQIGPEANTILTQADGYYNTYTQSALQANLSGTYNYSFWQSKITLQVREGQYGTLLDDSTVTLTNTTPSFSYTNTSTFNGTQIYYLDVDKFYHVETSTSGYSGNDTYFNYSTLGEYTFTVYLYANYTAAFYDEFTETPFNMSSPDVITQYTVCADGQQFSQVITNNSFTIPTICEIYKIKFVVSYPTDRYYRTLLPRAFNTTNVTIWLVDLDKAQLVFNTFEVYDLTEEYTNIRVYFKKNIGGEEYIITSDYINIEEKIGTYLMQGEEYTVEIESDQLPTRNLGQYSADAAGEKVIRLFTITADSDPTDSVSNDKWWLTTSNSTGVDRVEVYYESENIDTVRLNIYNESSSGQLLYTSTVTADSAIFYYIPNSTFANSTFFVTLNGTKETAYINDSFYFTSAVRTYSNIILDLITFGFVTRENVMWFLLILITVIALSFTITTGNIGAIVIVGIAAFFNYVGWFNLTGVLLGLAILVTVITFMKGKDKED